MWYLLIQLEAFELRENIENMQITGDIADAVELEKDIASRLAMEGVELERYLEEKDVEHMKLSAARIIYLSKVVASYLHIFYLSTLIKLMRIFLCRHLTK